MSDSKKRVLPWKKQKDAHKTCNSLYKKEVVIKKTSKILIGNQSNKKVILHSPSETLTLCLVQSSQKIHQLTAEKPSIPDS